jgi:membrane-associated phospholipid phosphatase
MKLTKKKKEQINKFLLKIPSAIFSFPLVMTVLTILLIKYIPYSGLILSSIFFYIFTPILAYFYLHKKGLITDKKFDFNIRKREERLPYNFIIVLGFLTNFLLLSMYKVPVAKEIALLLFISFLLFTIITLFWKISGHMTQTVLCILILAYIFPSARTYILLIGYLVCVPLVGLSRVKLGHHNIWQVVAGTLVTTSVGLLFFTIV